MSNETSPAPLCTGGVVVESDSKTASSSALARNVPAAPSALLRSESSSTAIAHLRLVQAKRLKRQWGPARQ